MRTKATLTTSLLVTLLGLGLAAPTLANANQLACEDESNLCVESGGKWFPDDSTNGKDRRRQSKKTAGTLTIRVEGGRGSVFINGRYAGTAPLEGVEIPSGKNDLQVRDGSTVIANGALGVGKDSDVVAVVRHP